MKIAIVTSAFPPDGAKSGNAPFLFELAKALVTAGHSVCVAALTEGQSATEILEGIEVRRVHYAQAQDGQAVSQALSKLPTTATFLPRAVSLYKDLKETVDEFSPEVIECVDNGFEGLFWALARSYPLVIRSLCPQFLLMQQASPPPLPDDEKLIHALEALALQNADAITTPSRSMAGIISEASKVPVEEISIIANPLNLPETTSSPALECKDELARRQGKELNLVFVGRVEKLKGCDILIEALPLIQKEYPGVKLKLIGSFAENAQDPGQFIHSLRTRLSHFGLSEACHFVGAIPRQELPKQTMAADICVFPSRYDSSPYACLEAMSHGAAVVASRIGGIPEYVEDGVSGLLFEMGNHEALAEAVIKLAGDHELRNSVRQAAIKRVRELCHPARTAQESVKVYERAMANFSPTRKSYEALSRIPETMRAIVGDWLRGDWLVR